MSLLFRYFLSVIALLFGVIFLSFRKKYRYWQKRGVKNYLHPQFPWGNLGKIFTGKLGIGDCIRDLHQNTDGDFVGVYLVGSPAMLVRDPELVKTILVKDFNYFMDRGIYNDEKKEPTSGHLFKLNGNRWKNLRNKLTPAFTAGKLRMMFETITDVSGKLNQHLQISKSGALNLDIEDLSTRYSADIIASTIFGIETNSFADKSNDFILMAKDLFVSESYIRIFKAVLQLFFPKIFHFLQVQTVKPAQDQFISKMVREVINYRENNNVVRKDMMQLLIQLRNKGCVDTQNDVGEILQETAHQNGSHLSLNEVSAQAYTFFFAGFETAASTMTFLLYECALDHKLQDRIHKNVEETLKRFDGSITYESVSEMEYLHWAVSETLRKYPILSFLNRIATNDYKMPNSDIVIEKGTRVLISISGLQHDPKHFPEPEKFVPERFKPDNLSSRHPFTYLPFGEGPRNCIGKRMGKMMVAVGVAAILKDYVVDVCQQTQIPLKYNKLAYFTKSTKPIVLKIYARQ